MNASDTVASTTAAAFACDLHGQILAWNAAAECLLGVRADEARAHLCHQLLQGRDVFGNRYCGEACPLVRMAMRREPVAGFRLDVLAADGRRRCVAVAVVLLPGDDRSRLALVHLLTPDRDEATAELRRRPRDSVDGTRLTRRQLEVLRLLAQGASTDAIARRLSISSTTVRNHVQALLRALDAHSRLEAVAVARRHDLV